MVQMKKRLPLGGSRGGENWGSLTGVNGMMVLDDTHELLAAANTPTAPPESSGAMGRRNDSV
jgi:hypothetical protein